MCIYIVMRILSYSGLILITAVILAIIWKYIFQERFAEVVPTKIVFTMQPVLDKYWGPQGAIYNYIDSPTEYQGLLQMQEREIDPAVVGTDNIELYIVADGYNAQKNDLRDNRVAESPDAYFVRVGLPEVITQLDCTYSLLNKRIGYIDETDLGFIRGLMTAYRTNPEMADLHRVPITAWPKLRDYLKREKIDVIITHVIPYSQMHLDLLDQTVVLDGFSGIDPERMRIVYPWAKPAPLVVEQWRLPGAVLLVNRTDKSPIYKFKLGLYQIRANIKEAESENFAATTAAVKQYKEDPVAADLAYKCYGSPQTTRKIACESPYDMLGEPKYLHTEWDRPCKENEDCPFYNGSRGGCGEGGICELPLGVRRLGFRKYNDRGLYAPYCYGAGGSCRGGSDYAFKDDGRQGDPDHYDILF